MAKKWIGLVLTLIGVIAVVLFCHSFELKNVTIEGLTRYSREEFIQKLEIKFPGNLTPVFCSVDELWQKEIPYVEKYEITYMDKNTARIVVHEKRVTGCVCVMGRYLYFDKDGIVVNSSAERMKSVPVITGLEFTEIALYQKLQIQKESLFKQILQLTTLIEANEIAVDEIAFDANYEVTLLVGEITVKLGKKENYDEPLNALKGILDVLDARTGTLDMRNYSKENQDVNFK